MFRLASKPLRRQPAALPARTSTARTASCRSVFAASRHASTAASSSPGGSRISTVFGALMLLGVASTAYGLYEFYGLFTMWPKEVRSDLRAGIKAKNQGDLAMSERFLRRALDTAHTLPLDAFGSAPHLKLSGIAIALAGVLEDANRPDAAYDVYATALAELRAAKAAAPGLSGKERLRAVALAYKLGEMAETYQLPAADAERWLVYAVEELLRTLRDEQAAARVHAPGEDAREDRVMLEELELPSWVHTTDVVAPLQALGAFYNRAGKQEYAIPLYLSALNVLLPPGKQASAENRCQGSDLMNSIADSLLIGAPTPKKRAQAETWVKKAIAVIEETQKTHARDPEGLAHCELVLAAALFNLGSMQEMSGDLSSAKDSYTRSRKQSILLKQRDGLIQADTAIRRVDRLSSQQRKESNTQ